MKHYGQYLPFAGRPVKYQSEDIEILINKKEKLELELKNLNSLINNKELEFEYFIQDEWTNEEIQEAKVKSQKKI